MKERKDEILDRILEAHPPPPAPDWFEARLMARIRSEKEERESTRIQWLALIRVAAVGVVAVFLLLAVFDYSGTISPGGTEVSQAELHEALDALASYQQEAEQWSYDLF